MIDFKIENHMREVDEMVVKNAEPAREDGKKLACGKCRRTGESICLYCARNGCGDVDFFEDQKK